MKKVITDGSELEDKAVSSEYKGADGKVKVICDGSAVDEGNTSWEDKDGAPSMPNTIESLPE